MSYFPSFWPAPENGTSFGFFWTKSSFLLSSILISTSPPLASLLNSCGISLQVNTSSSLLQYSVTQQHCCDKTYWLTASLSLSYPLLIECKNSLSSGLCPSLSGPSSTEKPFLQNDSFFVTLSLATDTLIPGTYSLGPSVSPNLNPTKNHQKSSLACWFSSQNNDGDNN